jgi:ribosome-binding factor A
MMASRRQRRVADLIHETVSDLLRRKIRDPRLDGVTITDVEITADLQNATVFYSVLDATDENKSEVQAGLDHAGGYLRRELASVLTLRYTPQLAFRLDQSFVAGQRIEQLLNSLRESE